MVVLDRRGAGFLGGEAGRGRERGRAGTQAIARPVAMYGRKRGTCVYSSVV